MIRGPEGPKCFALPSQTENLPERPPGSLFGDNPSGWAFGQTGQIHTGRANPFRALVAGLTADEFLLLREVVDKRRRREEVGVGTLAEAAAAYRLEPAFPGTRRPISTGSSTSSGSTKHRTHRGDDRKGGASYPDSRRDLPLLGDRRGFTHYPNCWIKRSRKLQTPCSACRAQARTPPRPIRHPCAALARTCQRRTIAKTISTVFDY